MTDDHMRRQPETDPSLPFRLTADDLLGDLAWPRLFHAPRLALRSGRVGIGVAALLVLSLVDQLLAGIAGGASVVETVARALVGSVDSAGARLAELDAGGALRAVLLGYGDAATLVWAEAPVRAIVVMPLTVLGLAFASVAIGRLSAEELARGRRGTWVEGLRWAAGSVSGILFAFVLPLLVAGLLVGVLAVGGWVLLSVPFVNVAGALFGVVGLVLSLGMALVLIGYALGVPLFAPALAVEGGDGIDAMHRSYAYLFARPARFVAYSALLGVQGLIVVSVLAAVAGLTVHLGVWSGSLLLGERASLVASGVASERLGPGGRAAASVMHVVLQLPALLVAGYVVSYWSSASTVLYLVMRRLVDGQDMVDIHVPGEIDARVDDILSRRGEAISAAQAESDRPA